MPDDKKIIQYIDCQHEGYNALFGIKIADKYTIGNCVGSGSFGKVFEVQDTSHVIKISLDSKTLANEIRTLKAMEISSKSRGVT